MSEMTSASLPCAPAPEIDPECPAFIDAHIGEFYLDDKLASVDGDRREFSASPNIVGCAVVELDFPSELTMWIEQKMERKKMKERPVMMMDREEGKKIASNGVRC